MRLDADVGLPVLQSQLPENADYVCILGAGPGLSPRVRKNLTQVDLLGYADHPLQRSNASPLRPAGKALVPARQHKYDDVHDEHGDEGQQNHD